MRLYYEVIVHYYYELFIQFLIWWVVFWANICGALALRLLYLFVLFLSFIFSYFNSSRLISTHTCVGKGWLCGGFDKFFLCVQNMPNLDNVDNYLLLDWISFIFGLKKWLTISLFQFPFYWTTTCAYCYEVEMKTSNC